jgi:galactitol PTS system EIIB component
MVRRKRLLVACGTGIATSTHVADRLSREFAKRGLEVDITQGRVAEIGSYADDVDAIVTTSAVAGQFGKPVVSGIPFLTGIGDQEALDQILRALNGGA